VAGAILTQRRRDRIGASSDRRPEGKAGHRAAINGQRRFRQKELPEAKRLKRWLQTRFLQLRRKPVGCFLVARRSCSMLAQVVISDQVAIHALAGDRARRRRRWAGGALCLAVSGAG